MMTQDVVTTVIIGEEFNQEDADNEEEEETIVAYADQNTSEVEDGEGMQELDNEQEEFEEDDEDRKIQFPVQSVQFQKFRKLTSVLKQEPRQQSKPPLSTHVIDSTRGAPVAGLQVSLYKLIDGRWTYINEGVTGTDGRFSQFVDVNDFTPGRYKLHYDVDRYFEARKTDTLYPFIEIVMDCKGGNEIYHIPVLISPYGYTTYRGT